MIYLLFLGISEKSLKRNLPVPPLYSRLFDVYVFFVSHGWGPQWAELLVVVLLESRWRLVGQRRVWILFSVGLHWLVCDRGSMGSRWLGESVKGA